MKYNVVLALVFLSVVALSNCALPREEVPGSYLVTLHPGQNAAKVARELGFESWKEIGGEGSNIFLFKHADKSGFSLKRHVDSLSLHESVLFVEPDSILDIQPQQVFDDPDLPNYWHIYKVNNSVDVNVTPLWARGINGAGILVGVIDSGIFVADTNSDMKLDANVDSALSIKLTDNSANWQPATPTSGQDHGTFVAGTIAGLANNSFCGAGVAYAAKTVAMQIDFAGGVFASNLITSLGHGTSTIWIKNYSLGFPACTPDRNCTLSAIPQTLDTAMQDAVTTGRNGRGTVLVFAAGNDGDAGADTNMSGLLTTRFPLTVSATGPDGVKASYSTYGSGVHIAAPGGDEAKTKLFGSSLQGTGAAECSSDIGTSFAAPVVSGVIALMLSQNANLGWRDVKEILAKTALKNDPTDTDWAVNAAGYNINHKYGFGLVDANAAVNMAATWTNVGPEISDVVSATTPVTLPAGQTVTVTIKITKNLIVEHVQALLNITGSPAKLKIVLQSPQGTQSVLNRGDVNSLDTFTDWAFLTVRNWGESSAGDWLIVLTNQDSTDATLTNYAVGVGGRNAFNSAADRLSSPLSFLF